MVSVEAALGADAQPRRESTRRAGQGTASKAMERAVEKVGRLGCTQKHMTALKKSRAQ